MLQGPLRPEGPCIRGPGRPVCWRCQGPRLPVKSLCFGGPIAVGGPGAVRGPCCPRCQGPGFVQRARASDARDGAPDCQGPVLQGLGWRQCGRQSQGARETEVGVRETCRAPFFVDPGFQGGGAVRGLG